MKQEEINSLIPLGDFKALLGLDDRDDGLSVFALSSATAAMEKYCRRQLREKTCVDTLKFTGEHSFLLREYPVREIAGVEAGGQSLAPEWFTTLPELDSNPYDIPWDGPFYLALIPGSHLRRDKVIRRGTSPFRLGGMFRVTYRAGYAHGGTPADLASACLELAYWNFTRYKNKRIGITGAGQGKDERLEDTMPEQVKFLLEPYIRRMI